MTSTLIVFFIFFQSLFVLAIGQTCRNLPVYASCSSNPDCGCLPFSSLDDLSGVCAYLHLNASKLRTCNANNYYCDQPYTVCVHHPSLSINQPLCYPTGMASLDICPPLYPTSTLSSTLPPPPPSTTTLSITNEEICSNVSWTKQGVTVAGSLHSGTSLHQLHNPVAILFDSNLNTLYVGDNGNGRITTWKQDVKSGVIVAGNNGQGNRTNQFGWVADILVDPKDGSLIICDARNRRIIRWLELTRQPEILIDQLYCTGLALDNQRLLYVAEHDNHRITRWILGETETHFEKVVAGGNEKGNQLDQLNEPTAVFVDDNLTVYVADYGNDRLVKWTKDAEEGILLGKIRFPKTIHVSQSGNIYSIDGYYNRVIRWTPDNINGTIIIGEQQYTLSQPADLAFDRNGNVYVSNYGNSRVDKFDIDKSTCF